VIPARRVIGFGDMHNVRRPADRNKEKRILSPFCVCSVSQRVFPGRMAGKALITLGKAAGAERKTFIFVNNRLGGKALDTIGGMLGKWVIYGDNLAR